jgi:hypothetical protein
MTKVNVRLCITVLFLTAIMLLLSGIAVNADITGQDGEVSVTIPVGAYQIKDTEQGLKVFVENFGRLLVPGKPNLPSKIFAIAIPPGAEVAEVSFDLGESIVLPGSYQISPASLPRVICQEDPIVYEKERQKYEENFKSVYGSDKSYPASVVEFVRTSGFRKFNLVDIRVIPFSYHPQSGKLTYYPDIAVRISYTFPDNFSSKNIMIDEIPRKEEIAEKLILNYDQAKDWYPRATGDEETFDYVIITTESLSSSVTSLVNWETSKGRNVKVITTTWIDSNYDGYDLAEKIRNFLREKYPSSEWGIEDVLLVGDYGDPPMRRVWQDVGYGKPRTDYYYAELSLPDSLSWDADGDHQWCEDYSDPIDFYTEVNVGRIPWSSTATVQQICQKSVAYEQNNELEFKRSILLLGAFFWDNTDNAVLMETKFSHPSLADWTATRMYEMGYSSYSCDYNLRSYNVRPVWSSGKFSFVNWAGHGSPYGCYILYSTGEAFVSTSTCSFLNDNYPAIIFADACSNSDTEYNNLGQAMLQRGAVGFLGATEVAYGMPAWNDPFDGSSQSLDYFFTIAVTSGDVTQGEAHQWALGQMYTADLWYYTKYEMCQWGALWGNPDLKLEYLYLCGDCSTDEEVNVTDVVYLINYLFQNGPAPQPMKVGNVNCDDEVSVTDVVYLINYLFRSGPNPCDPDDDQEPNC